MVFSPAVRGWNVQLSQSPQCTSYIGYTRSRFGKCMRTPLQHDTAFFTAIFTGYGWASGEWSSQHYMRESRNLLAFANNFGGGAWENFNEAWNSDGNQCCFPSIWQHTTSFLRPFVRSAAVQKATHQNYGKKVAFADESKKAPISNKVADGLLHEDVVVVNARPCA